MIQMPSYVSAWQPYPRKAAARVNIPMLTFKRGRDGLTKKDRAADALVLPDGGLILHPELHRCSPWCGPVGSGRSQLHFTRGCLHAACPHDTRGIASTARCATRTDDGAEENSGPP